MIYIQLDAIMIQPSGGKVKKYMQPFGCIFKETPNEYFFRSVPFPG